MSTPQTDQYWLAQEAIYQDFCTLVDNTKYIAGKDALTKMSNLEGIDPETYQKCKEYLLEKKIRLDEDWDEWADVPMSEEDDPNVQYQQHVLDKERDEADQADMRNAPSEGFKV